MRVIQMMSLGFFSPLFERMFLFAVFSLLMKLDRREKIERERKGEEEEEQAHDFQIWFCITSDKDIRPDV